MCFMLLNLDAGFRVILKASLKCSNGITLRDEFSSIPELWAEVLPVLGTGESLILSHRKDLEDGSEEDSIEVKRHTSALYR